MLFVAGPGANEGLHLWLSIDIKHNIGCLASPPTRSFFFFEQENGPDGPRSCLYYHVNNSAAFPMTSTKEEITTRSLNNAERTAVERFQMQSGPYPPKQPQRRADLTATWDETHLGCRGRRSNTTSCHRAVAPRTSSRGWTASHMAPWSGGIVTGGGSQRTAPEVRCAALWQEDATMQRRRNCWLHNHPRRRLKTAEVAKTCSPSIMGSEKSICSCKCSRSNAGSPSPTRADTRKTSHA